MTANPFKNLANDRKSLHEFGKRKQMNITTTIYMDLYGFTWIYLDLHEFAWICMEILSYCLYVAPGATHLAESAAPYFHMLMLIDSVLNLDRVYSRKNMNKRNNRDNKEYH